MFPWTSLSTRIIVCPLLFNKKVVGLEKLCSQQLLEQAITEENAIEMWSTAELYQLDKLLARVFIFVAANWKKIKLSPEFKKIPREYTDKLVDYLIDTA